MKGVRVVKTKRGKKTKKGLVLYQAPRYSRRIPLSLAGVPNNKMVKMRYCETITLNAGTAGTAGHIFRCNSIFDPNQSGTGHQPLSHDQWALFYNHYRVFGSKITVHFSATNANAPMLAGVYLNDDLNAPASGLVHNYIESGRGRWKLLDNNGGPSNGVVRLNYSAKKFHNRVDVKDCTDLKASFGSNPSEEAFFFIWAGSQESATDPGPVYATVIIDYIVGLEEPKDLAQS